MNILIAAYFLVNGIMVGSYYESRDSILRNVLRFIFLGCFGTPYLIVSLLYIILELSVKKIDTTFQVRFFYHFYFTKKWSAPIDKNNLKAIYRVNWIGASKLQGAWEVVVEFIKWYNKQK